MTPEAKSQLRKTIRALRRQLLGDLKSSGESTYRFALNISKVTLKAAEKVKRRRIDAWVAEQVRTQAGRKTKRTAEEFRRDLEKQAAYTLLNRMVILRLMESMGLRNVKVVTGGWESTAYKDFRQLAPALVHGDPSEGLAFLLQLVFEELAIDMPGLYGPAGEVELTELMPLHTEMERHWAYYVPQPIPEDAVEHASESVRDLKILDPAVGSGHFLVVAFDLLFALYQEEARHRGETDDADKWSDKAIVERILEYNLHGIDLDPRAVQIAAAALWMKAQAKCPDAQPAQLNLVASNLGIASLPDNDPALVELRRAVEAETGIPAKLTNQIIEALRGADHLGSLLKVDKTIEEAIKQHEKEIGWEGNAIQLKMFPDGRIEQSKLPFPRERTQTNLLTEIESFLTRHSSGDELGLRLRGQQLAAGVRFLRMIREHSHDLVVGNPPYLGGARQQER